MPIRGKSKCESCGRNAHGGTHCRKCTRGGGGAAGYRSLDNMPTEADLQREATKQKRIAQRTKAAADRAAKHKAAMDKAAAEKAARRKGK